MCGIAGILRFANQKIIYNEVVSLLNCIYHRGPDSEGVWVNERGNVGLGHRRLSILDLTDNGAQPMLYANGRLNIVYNGEVFNFVELRKELLAKGYTFKSDTDTEVILAAYHAWGKDCLYKFNGFFAFALWDEQQQELWIVRDRFGIKPLYFLYQDKLQFVFGSETEQFKYIDGYQRKFDEALSCYAIQNCWGIDGLGKTIFKEIEQVRPGHYMLIKSDGRKEIVNWWTTADHLVNVPSSYERQVETFKELFVDAVKIRLRSDVSIGSALSGGLDSSSVFSTIYKIASSGKHIYRLPSEWQCAFVADFPGTEQDERRYAEMVLKQTGGKVMFADCSSDEDLVSNILKGVINYDTISATPLFIIDKLYGAMRQKGITVSMDGHGVDEMMYGYPFNVLSAYQYFKKNGNKKSIDLLDTYRNMLLPAERRTFDQNRRFGTRVNRFLKRKINKSFQTTSKSKDKNIWLNEDLIQCVQLPSVIIPDGFNEPDSQLYGDFHFTTLPHILRNFDKGSMRNSIEIRMPFMDYRLVCFVFSLPIDSKIANGFTKRILRDAMKQILPEEVRSRSLKTGLNAPLKTWFNNDLREFIIDEVTSHSFLKSNLWNGKIIGDFAVSKCKNRNWAWDECIKFWPVLNAHLLFKQSTTYLGNKNYLNKSNLLNGR